MPFRSLLFRDWALCARVTAAPRTTGGTGFLASPFRTRTQSLFVFHSPGPDCGNGHLYGSRTPVLCFGAESPRRAGQKGSL
jgi:hypothetical protein